MELLSAEFMYMALMHMELMLWLTRYVDLMHVDVMLGEQCTW